MQSKPAGTNYLIRLGAENTIGEVSSDTVSVLLASVPDAPAAPTKSLLNETYAEIAMSPNLPAANGDDTIKSYELQLKVGYSEDTWSTVLGGPEQLSLDLLYVLPITVAGQLIQARARCMNTIGWSEYSSANYVYLAHAPSRPPKPIYDSSTTSTISVRWLPSENTGGSTIRGYELKK